ncbi:MAG: hypothetical protein A2017_18005 [Lentisphaerae bacterium GWF2_44_16]|nr:MAG: hypothetical protein A2017_18005 [Lentisphaerae bacterium GWF2_44_16]
MSRNNKPETSSLDKIRRKRRIILACGSVLLLSLLLYSVLRPNPEKVKFNQLKNDLLRMVEKKDAGKDIKQISGRLAGNLERGEKSSDFSKLQESMSSLSPEARKRLTNEIMCERLNSIRKKMEGLNEQEQDKLVDDMTKDLQDNFEKMNKKKKDKLKDDLNSKEGKDKMKDAMDFYYKNFKAKEREKLDPLVHETMKQINSL